jgi:hypothetical protein
LPGFVKTVLPIDFVANGAQEDCVGSFAFFERALRPFDLVFGVVMTAAFDLSI